MAGKGIGCGTPTIMGFSYCEAGRIWPGPGRHAAEVECLLEMNLAPGETFTAQVYKRMIEVEAGASPQVPLGLKPAAQGTLEVRHSTAPERPVPIVPRLPPAAKPRKLRGLAAKMAKACLQEPGEDEKSLTRLLGRMEPYYYMAHAFPNLHRDALLEAVQDKTQDWALRHHAASMLEASDSEEITAPLAAILLDKAEHPQVRAGAAFGLYTVAAKSPEGREALMQVVADTTTPKAILDLAMMSVAHIGVENIDLMLRLIELPVGTWDDVGIRFNAIRTIARSPDPRAMEALVRLLDKFAPNSLTRRVVIDELMVVSTSIMRYWVKNPLCLRRSPILSSIQKRQGVVRTRFSMALSAERKSFSKW
jgi:hypothetical protein